MADKIGNKRRAHLYIVEWMESRGLSYEALATRMGTSRPTAWRWVNKQTRLDPEKIAAIAYALGREPEDLWRLPGRPSLDAIVRDETDETVAMAADVVRRITADRKAS